MPADTQLVSLLGDALATFCFSAYQLHAERDGKALSRFAGKTSGWTGGEAVTGSTRFDLASLTKVVATTSVFARLTEAKVLGPETRVAQALPELPPALGSLTFRELLTHTSGL